jgi:hypothetical protein
MDVANVRDAAAARIAAAIDQNTTNCAVPCSGTTL